MSANLDLEDDEDHSLDSDLTDDAPISTAPATPSQPTTVVASPAAPTVNPAVLAYLKGKQQLAAAQDQVQKNHLASGITSALVQLGHGIARAPGQADLSGVNALAANDDAPVKNLVAQQSLGEKSLETQKMLEGSDPNDPTAQRLRSLYKPIFEKSGLDPNTLDGLSADQIKSYAQNPLEFIDKMKTSEANKALAVESQKDRYNLAHEAQQAKLDEKKTKDQSDSYTKLRKDLETFRGNQAAQQAAVAVQNGDKALALVNSTPTIQNLSLLADEMGKVALGGVPGEHGVQALMPNNAQTQIAKLREWITSNPNASAPDVAEYLKNNKDYLNQVIGISKKTLHDYRSNLAKGYKKRVSPDDYSEAMRDYGLSSDAPAAGADSAGTVLIRDPKGNIRNVPANLKDAALAAGGTLAQ